MIWATYTIVIWALSYVSGDCFRRDEYTMMSFGLVLQLWMWAFLLDHFGMWENLGMAMRVSPI